MTREEMIATVESLNGAPYVSTDRAHQAILFLVASIECGPNYLKIHQTTYLPLATCREFAHVARGVKPGTQVRPLWKGGKIQHSGWDDPENGGIALLMDSLVLTGHVVRT